MFWFILVGYGTSSTAYPSQKEGSEGVEGTLERRCAAGARRAAGCGAFAVSQGPQRAPRFRRGSFDAAGDSEGGHRYQQGGLERALYEKQRPGAAALLDDGQRQRIIAMVCSDPPEGRARWTVRLVAEEAVKRRLVPRVGRETVRILLLHHDLKPWREKNVVRGRTQ
jgi:hypothetical protein